MARMPSDPQVRICNRVTDMLTTPDPTAVQDECSRCNSVVWFTAGQQVPAEMMHAELICTRCIAADGNLRSRVDPDIVQKIHEQHAIADWYRN
jgi:hypothetical protein